MLLPHTDILPEYSIRPFNGHYLWFSVWAAPFTRQLLSVWNPENLAWKKKMHAAVGPTGQLMNCHLRDLFPQHLALKLTGRVPKKLRNQTLISEKIQEAAQQTTSARLQKSTLTEKEWTSGNLRAFAILHGLEKVAHLPPCLQFRPRQLP